MNYLYLGYYIKNALKMNSPTGFPNIANIMVRIKFRILLVIELGLSGVLKYLKSGSLAYLWIFSSKGTLTSTEDELSIFTSSCY